MRAALRVHGALSRWAFAVTVLVSLAVLFVPASGVPVAPPGVDKLVHVLLFAALAVTARWAGIGVRAVAGLLLGYAAASELLQALPVLGRSAELVDWLADAGGVLVGLAVWEGAGRRIAAR
jgi:hypothetical protein